MLRTRALATIEIYDWREGHVLLRQLLLTEGERLIILNPADIKLLLEWLPVAAAKAIAAKPDPE